MPVPIPGPHQDVLPAPDADFALFATQMSAAWVPATFNVVVPLAATVVASATAFASALAIASDPTTRTAVTIASKDLQRVLTAVILRAAIRAAQAAFLAGTATAAQLADVGVRANEVIRTPIGLPGFAPLLGFSGSFPGVNRLRITQVDQVTGSPVTTRGYAYGIIGIQLERAVPTVPFALRQSTKRVLLSDPTATLVAGTLVTYRARYVTARGLFSPWSSVAGGVSQ